MENLLAAIPEQRGETFRGAVLGRRTGAPREQRGSRARATWSGSVETLVDRYAGELSGGQRRLVEIMRALMAEPEVLLLDEPMAGVHPRLAHEIGMLLVSLCEEGTTMIMVKHELSIMDEFCDPVFVLAEGHVWPTARCPPTGQGGSRGGLSCRLSCTRHPNRSRAAGRGSRCAPRR